MTFRSIEVAPWHGHFFFEGQTIPFHAGDSIAGALLAAGVSTFRTTPAKGSERAPYCLMGVCFDCLMRIDGVDNQRACMTMASQGLKIERQDGFRRDAVLTKAGRKP